MATFYHTENRPNAKFQITARGSKNVRVTDVNTQETFLVPEAELIPIGGGRVTPNIQDKFESLDKFVKVVVGGYANGLFLAGMGGTGKTYTVMTTLAAMNKVEGRDFKVCRGTTTPAGLFEFLKANPDKLIIFDDCDAVFKDQTALNILKAVLDTYPQRQVSWNKADGEDTFTFTGRVIFISNLDMDAVRSPHVRAVFTRVLTLVLGATREDVMLRLQQLVPTICQQHDAATQQQIREFIIQNADHWGSPSLRLLVHVSNLAHYAKESGEDWKQLALALEI